MILRATINFAVMILLGAAATAVAAPRSGSLPPNLPIIDVKPGKKPVTHALSSTMFTSGHPGTLLAGGIVTMFDQVPIDCANSAGCTIGVTAVAEVATASGEADSWALCVQVDGAFPGGCPYVGPLPADSSYVSGAIERSATVTQGKHKVGLAAYSGQGLYLYAWHATYNVYVP